MWNLENCIIFASTINKSKTLYGIQKNCIGTSVQTKLNPSYGAINEIVPKFSMRNKISFSKISDFRTTLAATPQSEEDYL